MIIYMYSIVCIGNKYVVMSIVICTRPVMYSRKRIYYINCVKFLYFVGYYCCVVIFVCCVILFMLWALIFLVGGTLPQKILQDIWYVGPTAWYLVSLGVDVETGEGPRSYVYPIIGYWRAIIYARLVLNFSNYNKFTLSLHYSLHYSLH